jgi:pSer/pThr/pTyr-binding forkhead associated (FHA) protein
MAAWLVRKSEAAATRYAIRGELTRIGRNRDNDIVLDHPQVSSHHAEIRFVDGVYRLRDLDSTNGTYISGERVSETTLVPPVVFQLGNSGPQLHFLLENAAPDLNQTVVAADRPRAAARTRRARQGGASDQTATIKRVMLKLDRSSKQFKIMIAVVVFALGGISAYGAIKLRRLTTETRMLHAQMQQIEIRLEQSGQKPAETEQLLDRLDEDQREEKKLESGVLYRIGPGRQEDPVVHGIRTLMAEFGAETYSIPPEFLDAVNSFIARYRGPDRAIFEHVLGDARPHVEAMREIFKQQHLPPDLAYMTVAESGIRAGETSFAGAVGWWQFTLATAARFGLRVDGPFDERRDVRKSTLAATKYIRELILDFGAGSSVMLALAAYDLGPAKVKQAIKRVSDPIKQRDFWYLYRTRALPPETRDYVPKVIAAMIIARHPEQFGF